jgi:predicted nucleotidyltransferase
MPTPTAPIEVTAPKPPGQGVGSTADISAISAITQLPQIRQALSAVVGLRLAIVFGSCAKGQAKPDSDLDMALAFDQAMSVQQHIALIEALALATGRPIDLIDLRTVGEPLLGQIMQHGVRILGSDVLHAQYITRHVMDAADFMPYQARILQERRQAWMHK